MNELSDARCSFLLYHKAKEVQEMKYLKIFTDFLDVVEPLDDEECGRLFKAMLGYSLDGREPQLTGNERFLWVVARQHMDREAEVYEKKVKHLKRGNVPVTEKKGSVSEQDKDKEKEKEKDKDNEKDKACVYLRAPAPWHTQDAHIYNNPLRVFSEGVDEIVKPSSHGRPYSHRASARAPVPPSGCGSGPAGH